MKGANDQFEKYGTNVIDILREPYDYSSIMHYGPYAFSANGKRTIVARKSGAQRMGQRVQFSEIDLRKINKLYHCDSAKSVEKNTVEDSDGKRALPRSKPLQPPQVNRFSFMFNRRFPLLPRWGWPPAVFGRRRWTCPWSNLALWSFAFGSLLFNLFVCSRPCLWINVLFNSP